MMVSRQTDQPNRAASRASVRQVDKTQDENVYMRRVERRRVLTAGK